MSTTDAIRFLDHQARECRGRDACEALCLLLPAMMKIMRLDRMDDFEAAAFRYGFKKDLAAVVVVSPPGQINGESIKRTGGNVDGLARPVPAGV